MPAEESAYATLGVWPGASRAEVDEAYRRLIKVHHPDRMGGDAGRAAEINRAYALIRSRNAVIRYERPHTRANERQRRRPRRFGWQFSLVLLVFATATVWLLDARSGPKARLPVRWPQSDSVTSKQPLLSPSFDEPLNARLIGGAVAEAVQFHNAGEFVSAEAYSRQCQSKLWREPNLAWFDACAAFDEATATLVGNDPVKPDRFEGPAVMSRELAAAHAISEDMLGADSRLHQIRSQVDLQLLPILDPAAGQRP